jgi:hypothetical protein
MPRLLLRRLEGVRSGSEDEELQKREGVEVETGQHSSFGD